MTITPTSLSRTARWMLTLAVFTSGMTTLAIELTASRLLGNVFGTSNLVWANVIGLMLLYLTVGYYVGGWLADRTPKATRLYQIIIWGAFFSGIVPLVARPVLVGAANAVIGYEAGVAFGSFLAVLVLFAVPITLLGCVSPFAIRIAVQEVNATGKIAGRLYAISTLGSLLGTFLPTLLTIPQLGTSGTFFLFAGILLAVAFAGLITLGKEGQIIAIRLALLPILLIILSALLRGGTLRPAPAESQLLYETDSAYNYIQVLETTMPLGRMADGQFEVIWEAGTRQLRLNEGQGIHSIWHPERRYYGGTWDMFLAAPFFTNRPQPRSLCVIGLAAGTITTQFADVYGNAILMDGIEIDPAIVEVGRRYFGMTQPNLRVMIEDGRFGLKRLGLQGAKYDLIAADAYRVPYVPWHMTTVEFFEEVRALLTEDGAVAINVGRTVNYATGVQDRRLVEAITNTMQQVFPSVHTLDVPESFNTILVATVKPTTLENLSRNRSALRQDAHPLLVQALDTALESVRPTVASHVLFTDDHAPVETIINDMVVRYLFGLPPE
ncbi:MAG: fused MFS/spermidine synthase [Anaerolineae bacterium]